MQRVRIVARVLVDGQMGGDAIADAEKTVQGVPEINLVETVVGSFWMWLRCRQSVLLGPHVRDGNHSIG